MSRNPFVNQVFVVFAGEINIAIKMATWLARVKEAGSRMILTGENSGMTIPTAINIPVSARLKVLVLLCMSNTPPSIYSVTQSVVRCLDIYPHLL